TAARLPQRRRAAVYSSARLRGSCPPPPLVTGSACGIVRLTAARGCWSGRQPTGQSARVSTQASDQTAQPRPSSSSRSAIPPIDTAAASHPRNFGSDNWAGAHPEVIDAIVAANVGHAPGYGGDAWTARFREIMAHHFGPDAQAFPVFNGTGANVLALQSAL